MAARESKWTGGLGSGGSGGGSDYWSDPVLNAGALPLTGNLDGEIRVVIAPNYPEYIWNGAAWVLYYDPLPNFTAQQVLYGNGTKVPARSIDFLYNNVTKILSIGTSTPTTNGRIILGGTSGIGQLDGGGGALNIIGGPLTISTNNPTDVMSFRPGGVELFKLDNNGFRASFFCDVTLNLLSASRAIYLDGSKNIKTSTTSDVELGYVTGLSGPIQPQINAKLNLAGGTMTGALNLNTAIPVGAFEAAPKAYVDNVAQGLDTKMSAAAATTANIALTGLQTIDGVILVAGDRVLVKDQSVASQNGIYIAAAGAWARSADMDTWAEVPGAFIFSEEGALFGGTGWVCIAPTAGTIGTTNIPFTQFSGAGTYKADGNGIETIGTVFYLELDGTTLSKSVTGIKVGDLSLADAQISATAAIKFTKMENKTANRALVTDSGGKLIAATTSDTEIGYLVGLTGDVQTQIDSISSIKQIVPVISNVVLTNKALHMVDTSAVRTLTLPDPLVVGPRGFLMVKDKTRTSDVNPITIARSSGGVKIEGVAANWILQETSSSTTFACDGTDWYIL